MSRMGNIITDDNYYMYMIDIGTNVVDNILNGLREKYTARFEPVPDLNPLAYNPLTINMFYDVERSRLYVTYKLDKERTIGLRCTDTELYNRVYTHMKMASREIDIPITVIGEPGRLPQYSHNRQYGVLDSDYYWLRASTQFLWYTIDGFDNGWTQPGYKGPSIYPYFVENKAQFKDDIAKSGITKVQLDNYIEEVRQLDLSYIHSNYLEISDYYDMFTQYQQIYNNYFGRTPIILKGEGFKPHWKTITIFINVQHDTYAEKSNPQIHDYGKVVNFDRVSQYIREWAIENGKQVPPE